MEALGERRIDIACVQEIRWRGSSCRYFGTTGSAVKVSVSIQYSVVVARSGYIRNVVV